jgi:hypothetical protein
MDGMRNGEFLQDGVKAPGRVGGGGVLKSWMILDSSLYAISSSR